MPCLEFWSCLFTIYVCVCIWMVQLPVYVLCSLHKYNRNVVVFMAFTMSINCYHPLACYTGQIIISNQYVSLFYRLNLYRDNVGTDYHINSEAFCTIYVPPTRSCLYIIYMKYIIKIQNGNYIFLIILVTFLLLFKQFVMFNIPLVFIAFMKC